MNTRALSIAAIFGALWGVINSLVAPYIFRATRLPIFCDIVGSVSLLAAMYVARRPSVGTLTGISATVVTLVLRPGAFYFLGFTLASMVLDSLASFAGYNKVFERRYAPVLVALCTVSMAVAGLVIGAVFMAPCDIAFAATWSGLHALGGFLGALVALPVLKGLEARLVATQGT